MNVLMVMEEECLVGEKIIVRVSEREEEEESFASGECVVVCIVAERWWARERERASRRNLCSVGIVGGA